MIIIMMFQSMENLVIFFFLCTLLHIQDVTMRITPLDPESQQPLGLESGAIKDKKLSSPDHFGSFEAKYCRLNNELAWCNVNDQHAPTDYFGDNSLIKIDLVYDLQINAIALQGYKSYRYGEKIQIYYHDGRTDIPYTVKGNQVIDVSNMKGDNYEYLMLRPPPRLTSSIVIKTQVGANSKCLRMEIYGNLPGTTPQLKEYNGNSARLPLQDAKMPANFQPKCTNTNTALITSDLDTQSFGQSEFLVQGVSYRSSYLQFEQPYAWCLKDGDMTVPYNNWASVNLKSEHLLYGIQVDGLKTVVDKPSDMYLASFFKFQYSLDSKVWADYHGGRELPSANYSVLQGKMLSFEIPLLAQYVRIRMRIVSRNITCIKLQVYGCVATKAPEITTTPITTPNSTNITTSEGRIYHYKIHQGDGNSIKTWKDTDYSRKETNDGFLSRGTGCLITGTNLKTSSPFTSDCWVGWNKISTPKPLLVLTLNDVTKVNAIIILTYVNETMRAGTIQRFSIDGGNTFPLPSIGYVCAPTSAYYISPQVVEYTIDLGGVLAKEISIEFTYSLEWIFVRQVSLQLGEVSAGALKLTKSFITCDTPPKPVISSPDSKTNNIVIIICIVLAVLFLCLLGFIVYHYRTSLHKVFESRTSRPIYVRNNYNEDRVLLNSPADNHKGFTNASTPYTRVAYKDGGEEREDVYASPDVTFYLPEKSFVENGVSKEYAKYSAPDPSNADTNSTMLYAQPSLKGQYAEPDHSSDKNTIYQGSAIYASTYENPYKAVIPSSLYSDPDYTVPDRGDSQKKSCRVFPRNQLTFKEKIGVGQFGEVQIAEASGLDEIYGTIGHYNSWGFPDTALVAVKLLKSEDKNIESEFMKEVDVMARLKHENVVRLLGVCKEPPVLMVVEYMENGDLNQFLRDRKPAEVTDVRISQIASNILPLETLIHIIQQVAAGMKYLHSEGFIHRDLATRNCLVGPAYQVKISDFGMSRYLYSKQYYRVEGKAVLPIRWMAPECLFYGKFTQLTDIWSFGITLWEIFTFARDSPYSHLTDPQVIENACESVQNVDKPFPHLRKPENCPDDIYDVMVKCWHKSPENRPPFAYLFRYFSEKCNYTEMGDI